MITSGSHSPRTAIGTTIQFLVRSKWVLTLTIAGLVTVAATLPPPVSDENTDEEYIRIMNLVDRADALRATGKADAAKAKDQEAYRALVIFQKTHPKWNTKTVEFRLTQIAQDIEGKPKESETSTKSKGHTNLEAPSKHASATMTGTTVKLLDAGAEPRKPLRLHVKAGDKQSMILNVKSSGAEAGGNSPPLSFPADVTVQNVAPNGDITYEIVLGAVGLADESNAPPQAAQIKTALAPLKGLTIAATVSDRGISKKSEIKSGGLADPMMSQVIDELKEAMANLAVPLPEEAVGNNAKWEVKMGTKSGGASMTETTSYQLVSIDGDHLSTTFTMTASAPDQKVQNMGIQMHITEGTNSGSGAVAIDLSKFVPLQITADLNNEMKGEAVSGGKKVPFDIKKAESMSLEAH
jgi:hypothetical protein